MASGPIMTEQARQSEPERLAGMTFIPGGLFAMGSDDFYPEERPAHQSSAGSLWMDDHPVTNAQFSRFVSETAYVTVAERYPDPQLFPTVDPIKLVPGSLVFRCPPGPVPLTDPSRWWDYVPGACWRRPEGPESHLEERDEHPVVHVAYEDAEAFARWAGKSLPNEAEWEHAARGGLDAFAYAWGHEFAPDGRMLANVWQGHFPWQNLCEDGYAGTSPVRAFPSNGYGLYDMIGNVWEWTSDDFGPHPAGHRSCCVARKPGRDVLAVPSGSDAGKVVKGGSHLCAPNHCRRYRPSARQPQTADTSASHIGFRCVVRAGG